MKTAAKLVRPLLIAAVLSAVGCARGPAHNGTTLVIGQGGDAVSLDPAVSVGSGDGTIMALCYERLTAIDPTSADGAAVGELARAWEVSPDGLSWTFHLQDGHRFVSGRAVTAADVAASFQRVGKVAREPSQGLFWMKSVQVIDPMTVRFTLNFPFPALAKVLTLTSGSIVDSAAAEQHAVSADSGQAWLGEHCEGSGSYGLKAWQRGQRITLISNPNASAPPAYFKTVEFKIVPEASSRRIELEKGDLDLISGLGAAEVERYAALKGVTLESSAASNSLSYLTLNTSRGVLGDVRVRQAIAKAIDYAALRDQVLRGQATTPTGFIPAGVPGFDPAKPAPTRDLAGAKALLAAAGHPRGLDLTMVVSQPGPVSELVQANLADAGIRLQLQRMSSAALDAARTNGDFDLLYDGWIMDFPDPFIFLNLVFSSPSDGGVGNFSQYNNPKVDQLLQAAMATADPAKRAALYDQAQDKIMADQPIVMLFSPKLVMAHKSSITGVTVDPYQPNYLNVATMQRK
jgi:peptide/nickel transport system substrate-binding protein